MRRSGTLTREYLKRNRLGLACELDPSTALWRASAWGDSWNQSVPVFTLITSFGLLGLS
jgi:hypothetical protein